MNMTEKDYFVHGISVDDKDVLVVTSYFGTHGLSWPKNISYQNKNYVFSTKTPLHSSLVGLYWSQAEYKIAV